MEKQECGCKNVASYKYYSEGEYDIFAPMFYLMSYKDYKKKIHEKNCLHRKTNEV